MVVASMSHDWLSSEPGGDAGRGSGSPRWDAPGLAAAGVGRRLSGRGGAAPHRLRRLPLTGSGLVRALGLCVALVASSTAVLHAGSLRSGLGFPPFRQASLCDAGTRATFGLGGSARGACRGWLEG
jgi:hypothetical protein